MSLKRSSNQVEIFPESKNCRSQHYVLYSSETVKDKLSRLIFCIPLRRVKQIEFLCRNIWGSGADCLNTLKEIFAYICYLKQIMEKLLQNSCAINWSCIRYKRFFSFAKLICCFLSSLHGGIRRQTVQCSFKISDAFSQELKMKWVLVGQLASAEIATWTWPEK